MQNKFKGFRNFVKGKGYYIALLLCTVVVGVSGYYLLTEKELGTLSIPNPTVETATTALSEPEKQSSGKPVSNLGEEEKSTEVLTTAPASFSLKKPVTGEVLSEIAIDHLAYNETTRDWRTHDGLDLAAQIGDCVYAAADGIVYTIYEDEHLGMTVVLHHKDGYSTHYSNLSQEIPVSVGDAISVGQAIGTVGQTACTENGSEPHVHFALYKNNDPIDPTDFLPES